MTHVEQAPEAVLSLPEMSNASMAALSNADARRASRRSLLSAGLLEGHIVQLLGEAERRQTYRDDGATSAAAWIAERFELTKAGARTFVHVAQKAWDVPRLMTALQAGEISFDKLRAVSHVATPESEAGLLEEARVVLCAYWPSWRGRTAPHRHRTPPLSVSDGL